MPTPRLLPPERGVRGVPGAGGRGAAGLVGEDPTRFGLALIGVRMRGAGGAALAARLERLSPGLPVVLMSGEDLTGLGAELLDAEFEGFLQKPFTFPDLLAQVRRTMRGPTA